MLTDAVLPDGDWRRVLEIVAHTCPNIEVVVSSRLGDRKLWIEPSKTFPPNHESCPHPPQGLLALSLLDAETSPASRAAEVHFIQQALDEAITIYGKFIAM